MECEVCGRPAVKKAEIEGVILNVCEECVSLGKEIKLPEIKKPDILPQPPPLEIDPSYYEKLRRAREIRRLTIKDLAGKLKIKASLLGKMERGKIKPAMDMARKLEQALNIKILTEYIPQKSKNKTRYPELTIGDVVDLK